MVEEPAMHNPGEGKDGSEEIIFKGWTMAMLPKPGVTDFLIQIHH
jgi:hypothetical protein